MRINLVCIIDITTIIILWFLFCHSNNIWDWSFISVFAIFVTLIFIKISFFIIFFFIYDLFFFVRLIPSFANLIRRNWCFNFRKNILKIFCFFFIIKLIVLLWFLWKISCFQNRSKLLRQPWNSVFNTSHHCLISFFIFIYSCKNWDEVLSWLFTCIFIEVIQLWSKPL